MDTNAICAIATPQGSSALGVIRVSGDNLKALLSHLFSRELLARKAVLTNIKDKGCLLDNCIVIFYPSPKSYTGEDVIEIIAHGNHIIMNSILEALCKSGVTLAEPGEFTQRALFNGKLSLIDAEATADLISASDIQAVKAAHNSLSGRFLNEIENISKKALSVRSEVESIINFPEDDVPEISISRIEKNTDDIYKLVASIISNSREGRRLNQRSTYAFIGRPNSGKSSIINCLLREDASIVASKAGTTRDCIEYELNINNKIVTIIDTAGIRESDDEIEQEGITRSLKIMENVDKFFYVIDHSKGLTDEDREFLDRQKITDYVIIYNKIDIKGIKPKVEKIDSCKIYISALKNEGLDLIKKSIIDDFIHIDKEQDIYLARSRHINHLKEALNHIENCKKNIREPSFDLLAEELRLAHLALSSILGQNPTEELLEEIFSSFCIGK